jgi:hypothetical protein
MFPAYLCKGPKICCVTAHLYVLSLPLAVDCPSHGSSVATAAIPPLHPCAKNICACCGDDASAEFCLRCCPLQVC